MGGSEKVEKEVERGAMGWSERWGERGGRDKERTSRGK
jgi:hypothetical protein